MEKENRTYSAHCLVLAFPAQGHINPMLQFSKRLQHKRIKVTFVTTRFMINTVMSGSASSSSNISIRTISDGFDEGGMNQAESLTAYLDRFREVGSQTLTDLIENLNASSDLPVNCIVYNSFLPWGLDVAKKFGLIAAGFFTQTCAAGSAYYHHYKGVLEVPLRETRILLPGVPPLEPQDLPTFFYDVGSKPGALEMLGGQFCNIDSADWVLCSTLTGSRLDGKDVAVEDDWTNNPLKILR